jgi:hypothetical protein
VGDHASISPRDVAAQLNSAIRSASSPEEGRKDGLGATAGIYDSIYGNKFQRKDSPPDFVHLEEII